MNVRSFTVIALTAAIAIGATAPARAAAAEIASFALSGPEQSAGPSGPGTKEYDADYDGAGTGMPEPNATSSTRKRSGAIISASQ